MNNAIWIYAIGFTAQILFSARLFIQWIASERAKKVISPTIFWQLSMFGSYLLFSYGWLIDDFSIILGQIISYYIYIWNLNMKHHWQSIPKIMRILFIATPVAVIIYFFADLNYQVERLFKNDEIPLWLVIFGSMGQIIFTLRFIYQWWYSRKAGESLLPKKFWVISLVGSLMIISYALLREDPVLIVGQLTGAFVYTRNLIIGKKSNYIN